jgi:hypothetical protein
MLSVEPSVEFVARVRMRIAAEPAPSPWRMSWAVATAGVCVLLITVTMAGIRMSQLSPTSTSSVLANISLLVPALVPGPLAAASVLRRDRPTPEMQGVMRANAETSQLVSTHLASGDYAAIEADAATLSRNFAYLERFWEGRQVEEAARFSRSGLTAAASLRAAAMSGDSSAVAAAVAAITAVCNACHARYREILPDNTYAIKL